MGKLKESKSRDQTMSRFWSLLHSGRGQRKGGIRRRWMLNSIGFVALVITLSVLSYSVFIVNYYYTNLRIGLESRAKDTVSFISKYFNSNYNQYQQSAYRIVQDFSDADKLELQFISTSGRIELSSLGIAAGFKAGTPDVRDALNTGLPSSWMGYDQTTGERVMSVSSPLVFSGSRVVGVMRYVTSLELVDKQIFYAVLIAVAVGAAVLSLVVISNLYFIRSIVRPVRELSEVAKKIAAGSYGVRIEKEYNDEIGELSDIINNMSAELSAAERMKSDFISSVSHELRTPLTVISGWGETLLSGDINDTKEVRKGIRIIMGEARRLSKMVEELLDFTRMEGGRLTMRMEEVDILSEFEESVFMYMDTLKREGLELEYNEEEEIPEIIGDRERLKQVFFNIFDNAAKHGRDGGKVSASIGTDEMGKWVVIRIRDYGMGIPPEELPQVKMKFYKGSSKARGSGIGLAVCDEIVRLHDGRLDIESQVGEGTLVSIYLPVHEQTQKRQAALEVSEFEKE